MMSDNKQEAKDSKEEATKLGISRAPGHEKVESETVNIIKATQEVERSQKENTANFHIQQNAFLANSGQQSIENVIKVTKERCEFLQRIAGTMKLCLQERKFFWIPRSIRISCF